MFRSAVARDPRVIFSWDAKHPDTEALQLRLELSPTVHLYWQMRVEVDMIACFGSPWDSFWRVGLRDQPRGNGWVEIGHFMLQPATVTRTPVMGELELFFERLYGVDVLTASLIASDLMALHAELEDSVAAPHRLGLYEAFCNRGRLEKHWDREARLKLQPIRENLTVWLDGLPSLSSVSWDFPVSA